MESPPVTCYKPAGVRQRDLDQVVLALEEWEALRLSDREGMGQHEAAALMGISKPTFNRVITEARHKVAEALTRGKSLVIEGGHFRLLNQMRNFACRGCGHQWQVPYGTGQRGIDLACPACGSRHIHRTEVNGHGPGRQPWGHQPSPEE